MSIVVKPNTFSAGATIFAGEHNDNYDKIYDEFNGNINNANIRTNAAIVDTKLAQITTTGKVHGSSLTAFASVPTSIGALPTAQIPAIDLAASGTGGVTGTLAIENGGTNATTASGAANSILPDQSGQSGSFLTSDATDVSWGSPGGSEFFDSSGTFTVPTGITTVYITMVGGGGGGAGGGGSTAAGGGGGGESLISVPYTVTPSAGLTVTVGSGGVGSVSEADGTNGTASVFDSLTAVQGSKGETTAGGVGGGTGVDASGNTPGGLGHAGGTGGTKVTATPGAGGGTFFADGATGGNPGGVGTLGSGGGGGETGNRAGGDGGSGFVLVQW